MLKENTPAYLKDVTFKTERRGKDAEEKRIVVASFLLQPFTSELANLMDPEIRAELYNMSNGEPKKKIRSVEFALSSPLLMLSFRPAPDLPNPSIWLRNVKLGTKLKVRADKESPIFAANFTVDFEYPSADDLLLLAYGINCQHFLTFEEEQGDVLQDVSDEKPRKRKRERQPPLEDATSVN